MSERSQYKSQSYVTPLDTMVCAAGEVIQDQSRKGIDEILSMMTKQCFTVKRLFMYGAEQHGSN